MDCCTSPENLSPSTMDGKKAMAMAVADLMNGRELVVELQFLVQDTNTLGDDGVERANSLVTKILSSLTNAIEILNSDEGTPDVCRSLVTTTTDQASSDDRRSVDSNCKRNIPGTKDRRGGYKRRKASNSRTEITPKPIEDGHSWRKYGQKEILNAKHPRNYFRCTHKPDQGCQATKQVQKTDEEPSMYQTTYLGHHTCKDPLKSLQQFILEPSSPSTKPSNLFNLDPQHDYHPISPYFPSMKSEYTCNEVPLSPFECSAPLTMLASSSGSEPHDHNEVISSVYSCTTSTQSSELEFMFDTVFDDTFLEEGFFNDL